MVVMGIDPGVANTGFGVVRIDGPRMGAVDGGVIEAPAGEPIEAAWPDPRGAGRAARAGTSRWRWRSRTSTSAGTSARRSRSARRGASPCSPRPRRGVPCFDYTPQAVKLAVCGSGAGDQGPGPADGRHAARAFRSRRGPTTPPTPWRSRSATPGTPPRPSALRPRRPEVPVAMIASVRGEVLVRRPDHVVIESRRGRLPPRRLGRDAEARCRRAARRRRCTPISSRATTRWRCTGSPARRSATSSCT